MVINSANRQLFAPALVIISAGILFGCVSILYPFGRDQAIYAYAGKLLLEGKMNYLHVFDLKPPGIHFLFALIQFFSGESMLNARIFDIIWQCLTSILILIISFKLTGDKLISVFSAVSAIFLYYRQDYWHTLQADGALNLFFTLSVLLLLSSQNRHSFIKLFIAGICFAAVLLFKYTVISFLPLLFIALLADKKFVFTLRIKNLAVYSSGMIFVFAVLILLYFFTDSLNAFIDIQFTQTPLYTKIAYETESFTFIFNHTLKLFTHSAYTPLLLVSVFSLAYAFLKKEFTNTNIIIFAWLVSSVFSLVFQWKFYNYHYLVIIPPICVCSAYGLSLIKKMLSGRKQLYRMSLTAFILVFAVLAFKPYFQNYMNLKDYISGDTDMKASYIKNGITTDSVFMYRKTIKAVDIVQKNSGINDKIFVWGFDPLIYYLSQRYCSSRFIYNFPLLWKGENTVLRNEFLSALEKDKPKLIIIAKNDPLIYISGYDEDSGQLIKRFPEFDQILTLKYRFITNAEDYEIYSLNEW